MNKLIEKTEKTANVYAVQTANLLDEMDTSRDGAAAAQPTQ